MGSLTTQLALIDHHIEDAIEACHDGEYEVILASLEDLKELMEELKDRIGSPEDEEVIEDDFPPESPEYSHFRGDRPESDFNLKDQPDELLANAIQAIADLIHD